MSDRGSCLRELPAESSGRRRKRLPSSCPCSVSRSFFAALWKLRPKSSRTGRPGSPSARTMLSGLTSRCTRSVAWHIVRITSSSRVVLIAMPSSTSDCAWRHWCKVGPSINSVTMYGTTSLSSCKCALLSTKRGMPDDFIVSYALASLKKRPRRSGSFLLLIAFRNPSWPVALSTDPLGFALSTSRILFNTYPIILPPLVGHPSRCGRWSARVRASHHSLILIVLDYAPVGVRDSHDATTDSLDQCVVAVVVNGVGELLRVGVDTRTSSADVVAREEFFHSLACDGSYPTPASVQPTSPSPAGSCPDSGDNSSSKKPARPG